MVTSVVVLIMMLYRSIADTKADKLLQPVVSIFHPINMNNFASASEITTYSFS